MPERPSTALPYPIALRAWRELSSPAGDLGSSGWTSWRPGVQRHWRGTATGSNVGRANAHVRRAVASTVGWMKTVAAASALAVAFLAACGVGPAPLGGAGGASTAAPAATPTPAQEPAATVAELTALGEQMVPRHPEYGYYVDCVNFKENGVWAPPPAPVDYSACPITPELAARMQSTRAGFLTMMQDPARGRTVSVTPQPGGGLVVVTLDYSPPVRLELVVVRSGGRFLVGDVVAKGDVAGPNPPPVVFTEKPAPPSVAPPAAIAAGAVSRTLDVPWYRQAFGLSCEEASLRMALAYEGIATTDSAILDIIGTDERPPYYVDGVMHWANPYSTFVGNPNGSEVALTGYGTYYPTIAHAAGVLGGHVMRSGEGISPGSLYQNILAGHPAVVWITYRWVPASRSDYVAFDGQRIPYAGPVEHAVTAVGVDPGRILINDPLLGSSWIARPAFEAAYAIYGQMAVVLA